MIRLKQYMPYGLNNHSYHIAYKVIVHAVPTCEPLVTITFGVPAVASVCVKYAGLLLLANVELLESPTNTPVAWLLFDGEVAIQCVLFVVTAFEGTK